MYAVARSLDVWRMGQCLFMIFWMGGWCLLKVVVNGVRLPGDLVLSISRSVLVVRAALSLSFSVFWRGYPRSLKRFSSVAMASLA